MKLPVLARDRLRHALRAHPNIRRHVVHLAAIDHMDKERLLALSNILDIEVQAIVADVEEHGQGLESILEPEDLERHRYSDKYPAFNGIYEFKLKFEMLGKRVTRRMKAEYVYTPEWEYYDLRKKAPYVGWAGSTIRLSVLTVPDESIVMRDDGSFGKDEARWVEFNELIELGILPEKVWDGLYNAIEDQCEVEDAERRRTAASRPPENE